MKYIIAAMAMMASGSAFAQDEVSSAQDAAKIGGLRIETHLGIERPNLNETEGGTQYVAKLSSSLAYGVEVGYDFPVSSTATVGPYVAYDIAGSDICENGSLQPNVNYELCFKAKSNLSVGLRGALATGSKGEVYLGLGYDKYNYNYSEVLTNATTRAVISRYENTKGDNGIGVSMGYNHMITKNSFAGIGMKISEMGDFENSGWSLQRFQGQLNLGVRF